MSVPRHVLRRPGELLSLAEIMYALSGQGILRSFYFLGQYEAIAALSVASGESFDDETALQFREIFRTVAVSCFFLELDAARAAAERAMKNIDGGERNRETLDRAAADVFSRLDDELSNRKLFYIPNDKAEMFEAKHPFGEKISQRFPSATGDIEQSARCFALARYTACVFHLMRIMEVGLGALKDDLGITQWHSTWNAAIGQIRSVLKPQAGRKSTVAERRRKAFIESAAGYVQSVAFAWRNDTMHSVLRSYDEEESLDVFNAVKAFMGYLEKNLRPQRRRRS